MAPQSFETDRDDIFYVDTIVFKVFAPLEPIRLSKHLLNLPVFKVENTLFRVPRCGFEVPGCFFATMFTLPGPGEKGEQIEGTDDAHPILLEGIQKSHFKSFLKVLYPKLYKCLPAAGVPYDETYERQDAVNTYDDWIGVLHLSTKWDFPKIRKTSIESVSRCMPTHLSMQEKISLAKKYNVKKWLLDDYRKLVQKATLDFDVPILIHVLNHPGSPFETMFTLPQPKDDGGKEPASEEDPIVLEGIAASDFEAFLHALYSLPKDVDAPKFPINNPEHWFGVLNLATMWNFDKLRKKAVKETELIIKKKTPLEMISLGRKYAIPEWVKNGYIALCSQEDLKPEELAEPRSSNLALDWKTLGTLLYIWGSNQRRTETECQRCYRESQSYGFSFGEPTPSPKEKERSKRTQAITDLVHQRFKQELDELRAFSSLQPVMNRKFFILVATKSGGTHHVTGA
ncbi:hypothetical protein CPC08DRAFT_728349 [Agrocybe pediades]|nr:hypothetical protein CPC08DRAFT_728349 [Agrocybe pediades]